MKHLTILLVMMMAWIGFSSSTIEGSAKDNAPSIEFAKKSYDFGTIKEADGKVSCEFKFTNKGNAPLVIISASAGCGCTEPEYNEEPIAPGASSVIKVTYNPKGRPGEFNKMVNVRSNDPKHRKITLKISGIVVPAK